MTDSNKSNHSINNHEKYKEKFSLHRLRIAAKNLDVPALAFVPSQLQSEVLAIFTHGYTSHKSSILNWSHRLAQAGMASIVFDLPGHYLGDFKDILHFKDFVSESPLLFWQATEQLNSLLPKDKKQSLTKVIFGGHSLGALLSLLALEHGHSGLKVEANILVGFGLALDQKGKHLFESPFFKSTLELRAQLVSPCMAPEVMFPWIAEQKNSVGTRIPRSRLHFITGADDVVVGQQGSEELMAILNSNGHLTTLEKPGHLPHHLPELAASSIYHWCKKENYLR